MIKWNKYFKNWPHRYNLNADQNLPKLMPRVYRNVPWEILSNVSSNNDGINADYRDYCTYVQIWQWFMAKYCCNFYCSSTIGTCVEALRAGLKERRVNQTIDPMTTAHDSSHSPLYLSKYQMAPKCLQICNIFRYIFNYELEWIHYFVGSVTVTKSSRLEKLL